MKSVALALSFTLVLPLLASAQDPRFYRISGPVHVKITSLTSDGFITWTNVASNTIFTVQVATRIGGGAGGWTDYVQVPATNRVTTQRIFYRGTPPGGMVFIPGGSCRMGNSLIPGEGDVDELPVHSPNLTAQFMDGTEVGFQHWQSVREWALAQGYAFVNGGQGKDASHPVHTINWFDAVKWCNARSQMEGLDPVYYEDAVFTQVYKTGQMAPFAKWAARGYRLPTEAEWEKAARGGVKGRRFPWAGSDNISDAVANYYSLWFLGNPMYAYDKASVADFNPLFETGLLPYTSPGGHFPANSYGLADMAGNLAEWCWDWYDSGWYSTVDGSQPDTRGPAGPLTHHVLRGGSWSDVARGGRCADRNSATPDTADYTFGFRCVRSL